MVSDLETLGLVVGGAVGGTATLFGFAWGYVKCCEVRDSYETHKGLFDRGATTSRPSLLKSLVSVWNAEPMILMIL